MNEDERLAEWEAWINEEERPKVVQDMARKLPPWGSYKLKETGQFAEPLAYAENGTIRAYCWYEWEGRHLGIQVFGLDPDSFETTGDK